MKNILYFLVVWLLAVSAEAQQYRKVHTIEHQRLDGRIFLSTDGGAVWIEKTQNAAQDSPQTSATANIETTRLDGSIHFSSNGGRSWNRKQTAKAEIARDRVQEMSAHIVTSCNAVLPLPLTNTGTPQRVLLYSAVTGVLLESTAVVNSLQLPDSIANGSYMVVIQTDSTLYRYTLLLQR